MPAKRDHRIPHSLSKMWILLLCLICFTGCSSWPWPSSNRDAERLTRVIHTENARLKDLVVQLRSSNEDMAQRALDDASRISTLEEANRVLTTSVAAYQSERERMARNFQTLQQQVQVVLNDRDRLALNQAELNKTQKVTAATQDFVMPPEGVWDQATQSVRIPLKDWFLEDSPILRPNQDLRIDRLVKWVEMNADKIEAVAYYNQSPKSDQLIQTGSSVQALIEKSNQLENFENSENLDRIRALRLWELIEARLDPKKASNIRLNQAEDAPANDQNLSGEATITIYMNGV